MNVTGKALIAALAFFMAGPVLAQYTGPQSTPAGTVSSAKKLPDDSRVVLTGHIVEQTGKEHYTFRDQTGEIEIEIDNDIWQGRQVGADTKVRIHGEVDRDRAGVDIEVERLEIVGGGAGAQGFQGSGNAGS